MELLSDDALTAEVNRVCLIPIPITLDEILKHRECIVKMHCYIGNHRISYESGNLKNTMLIGKLLSRTMKQLFIVTNRIIKLQSRIILEYEMLPHCEHCKFNGGKQVKFAKNHFNDLKN